jgi:putative redox protein
MAPEKQASIIWKGAGLDFHARLGSGYEFEMSAPANTGGGSPMEFLLAGAAGCTAVDVVNILNKSRQKISSVEVEIKGIQAETPPNVYVEATIVYIIRGESVSSSAVEKAIELSQTKYCSASIMLKRAGMVLHSEYRIEEEATKPLAAEPAD